MYSIEIEDFIHWRDVTRELLKRKVPPSLMAFIEKPESLPLFTSCESFLALPILIQHISVPSQFLTLAKHVACHRNIKKWALLYAVIYRLTFEEKMLLNNVTDSQVSELLAMRKAISRDKHKMKAFVRFKKSARILPDQPVPLSEALQSPPDYFWAWFEPEHDITRLTSSFFTQRFATMQWSILTPDVCAHWDTKTLTFTQGIEKPEQSEDCMEDLWLEYYASIFNPARLKLKAMQSEMPKKYWKNLPEARLIPELTRMSTHKVEGMIASKGSQAWAKTAKSKHVQEQQTRLRNAVKNQ